MNFCGRNIRWQQLAQGLAAATTLLYVCSRVLVRTPPQNYGLVEHSWLQVLHVAFSEHLQFGHDIVFSFGPWGFLYGGYYPETHLVSIGVWTILAVLFWWAGWRTACHFFKPNLLSWLWLIVFVGATGTTRFLNIDVRLMAYILLLWVLHFFVEERPFTKTQAALAAALGLFSLIKFSMLVVAVVVVVAIATDTIFRQRRFPWILPVFAVSFLVFWIAAGQRLGSLGPFLRNSTRVMGGYTEAMMLNSPDDLQDVWCFLAGATLLIALTGYAAWKRHRYFGALPLAALGLVLFSAFKYGYVRHDAHDVTATLQLFLVALISLAILWPTVRGQDTQVMIASFMPALVVYYFAANTFNRYSDTGLTASLVRTLRVKDLLAPARLFLDQRRLRAAYVDYLASYRNSFPLPHLERGVDVYPWNQIALLAHGFHYQPRPVIQSYSAYTPELARLNAAHLRNEGAAEEILFEVQPIDDHYPSLEDGLSWPELLTRYDIQDLQMPFVVLKRSVKPREFQLILLSTNAINFDESVAVPPASPDPIWAEIEIHSTLRGAIATALYKPPILALEVALADGSLVRKRLIPGMAHSGFLLSPLIADAAAFAALSSTNGQASLAGVEVRSLRLFAEGRSSAMTCYRVPVRVRFYRLKFARQERRERTGLPQDAKPEGFVRQSRLQE